MGKSKEWEIAKAILEEAIRAGLVTLDEDDKTDIRCVTALGSPRSPMAKARRTGRTTSGIMLGH